MEVVFIQNSVCLQRTDGLPHAPLFDGGELSRLRLRLLMKWLLEN
jgi:hypothetical protein